MELVCYSDNEEAPEDDEQATTGDNAYRMGLRTNTLNSRISPWLKVLKVLHISYLRCHNAAGICF